MDQFPILAPQWHSGLQHNKPGISGHLSVEGLDQALLRGQLSSLQKAEAVGDHTMWHSSVLLIYSPFRHPLFMASEWL